MVDSIHAIWFLSFAAVSMNLWGVPAIAHIILSLEGFTGFNVVAAMRCTHCCCNSPQNICAGSLQALCLLISAGCLSWYLVASKRSLLGLGSMSVPEQELLHCHLSSSFPLFVLDLRGAVQLRVHQFWLLLGAKVKLCELEEVADIRSIFTKNMFLVKKARIKKLFNTKSPPRLV